MSKGARPEPKIAGKPEPKAARKPGPKIAGKPEPKVAGGKPPNTGAKPEPSTRPQILRKERWYYSIAKLYPPPLRRRLAQELIWAGYISPPEFWLAPTLLFAALAAAMSPLAEWALFGQITWIGLLAVPVAFFIVSALAYVVIYFRAEDAARRVEAVLPDAFQLIASNIRAGMTPFSAIRFAAREEFGPLEVQLNRATSKALGQASLEDALSSIATNIKSKVFERAIRLFVASINAGGRMADILEETASDIRASQSLKREIVTNTKTYTMFIMFTIIVGAPTLFSISIHFVEMMEAMTMDIGSGELIAQTGFSAGLASGITVSFLTYISVATLMITSCLASMMMGVITTGRAKQGIRYIPIMMFGSLIVFAIARKLIGTFFGGLI